MRALLLAVGIAVAVIVIARIAWMRARSSPSSRRATMARLRHSALDRGVERAALPPCRLSASPLARTAACKPAGHARARRRGARVHSAAEGRFRDTRRRETTAWPRSTATPTASGATWETGVARADSARASPRPVTGSLEIAEITIEALAAGEMGSDAKPGPRRLRPFTAPGDGSRWRSSRAENASPAAEYGL